jgi:WD40 repeat protein
MTDHRGVPKFLNMSDADYILVRNNLAVTVEEIQGEWLDPERVEDQMRLLADYLDILENEEDELSTLTEVDGSCQWLLEKDSFIRWRDSLEFGGRSEPDISSRLRAVSLNNTFRVSPQDPPRIFWLFGPPGSGKSHLSAYVIRQLQDHGCCSYYFLKHTDRSRQSLGGLLRSLAFQMAGRDVALRRSLLSMQQEGSFNAEVNDIRTIWKQLFLQQIFRKGFKEPQYWVIDALDEGIGGQELIKLFEGIPSKLPLNIFITSRHDSHTEKLFKNLPTVMEGIEVEDTLDDIRLFLEDNRDALHVEPATVEALIDELIQKSNGSFLWIRLVLQRLETLWNYRAIATAMREVPHDMDELYNRILGEMERRPNKDLARAILRWTITAARSLTTAELQDAIQHDIQDTVPMMEKMIGDVCGQLVVIERGGKVRLVHDTARDFLLKPDLNSEFAIDKMTAHGQVADVCLRYLIEGDGPQLPRRGRVSNSTSKSALEEYAHLYFSEHVVKGPSADTDAISLVCEFLDSRVLHWVEYIARRRDLDCLTQTAKNLDAWVDCRSDQSPLSKEMKVVRGWAVDLIRLVTVFGKHILSDPSCVHTVIPQLSPTGTEIYRRYGAASGAMAVVGLSDRGWADRIFSAPFHDGDTTSTACSERLYAVGLRSGIVVIYDSSTCQESLRLNHRVPIRQLEFSTLHEWILVSGSRKLSLWNYQNGELIWSVDTPSEPMALGFFAEDKVITTATRSNHIMRHSLSDGSVLSETSWHIGNRATSRAPPPMKVFMSSELNLVGVVYRMQRLCILDLDNLTRPRVFGGQMTVTALAFNPALKMMAVAFLDGEICIVNLSTLEKGPAIVADTEHLVVSADGKTLLVGGKTGKIQIYDFEKLTEVYSVSHDDEDIVSLIFSPNGLQILDVRRKEFNVWAPSALYRRKDNDDSGSQGRTSYGTALTQFQSHSGTEASIINAIAPNHTGDYIFCGRADGTVSVCETQRGKNQGTIFAHGSMGITFMEWSASQELLISCDTSSRIVVHQAQRVQRRTPSGVRFIWQTSKIFERRVEAPIQQTLSSIDGEYLLVSDLYNDHIWTTKGEDATIHQCGQPEPTRTVSQKWATHPRHKRRLYEIESHVVHVAKWSRDSTSPPMIETIESRSNERIDFETRDSGVHFIKFGDNMWAAYDNNPFTRPFIWEAPASANQQASTEATLERFNLVAPEVRYLIGMFRSQLVFFNHDGWVCTIRVDEQTHDKLHTRHFPVPHCWQSLSRHLRATVTPNGDVVIAKSDELAIVKRGLSL